MDNHSPSNPEPLILIIDGERGSAGLIKMRLEAAHFKTQILDNGYNILQSIKDFKPSAIVLSANIKTHNEVYVCRCVQESSESKNIPVVLITDGSRSVHKPQFPNWHIVTKPYDPSSFLALISQVLKQQRDHTSAPTPIPEVAAKANTVKIDLKALPIHADVIEKIPAKFIRHYKFVPIDYKNNVLTVATSNPNNGILRDDLYQYFGFNIESIFAEEADIDEAMKKYYGIGGETIDQIFADNSMDPSKDNLSFNQESEEDIAKLAGDASVIKLVNQILLEAQQKNASDIHIEPFQGKLKLRYRVDGVLIDAKVHENIVYFLPAIISRIKIMSGLNIVERRLPQDGRAKVNIKNEKIDLRISTIPTAYGESIVIRILPSSMLFSLEKLGLADREFKNLSELIKRPHGVIFVTGPTGSGKTTTLYAVLTTIKAENLGAKIITIEDPIEYQLDGITQVQVNPEIGFTFAKALRSFLRHDPDIMMVGEVRDHETAEMAIRMALTGHLLFSTIHTNDACSGITRLLDIGVEPYLLSSSVIAFMSQRLVRTICPECKREVKKSDQVLKEIGVLRSEISEVRKKREVDTKNKGYDHLRKQRTATPWLRKGEKCYEGKGCPACSNTGYKGRISIFELLIITKPIEDLIIQKATAEQIKREAIKQGMRTLYQDGFDKVTQGVTTFAEVLRVVQEEEIAS